ncbi:ribosome biogenesis protein tsr1 [Moniliophthora roreri MCA 2997]|uniref:Ribosome biogenesis protein tsr1 n=1 Tax=Moniliophthora roreri (strain MCA 2997) TaxID=1381753 RepID=V2XAU4_MONRO|nr:ribosome biogenesis protein tsr1 [Moniliophthora roreri MCA 2997]
MPEVQHHHRPTLKQQNKPFKSKHATKSSLKDAAKGRIARQSPKSTSTNSNSAAQLRHNRRNSAKQAQMKKKSTLISATRLFNGVDGAPRIIAVIPLTEDVSSVTTIKTLASSLDLSPEDEIVENGTWKMRADRFKTSLQFITVPYRDFYRSLEACKVADYTVFVLSPTVEVDAWGDTLLRTLQAQGLPEVITVVGSDDTVDSKSRSGILKSLLSFMQYFVPTQKRVFDLHSHSDTLNALRALSEGKPENVRWRDGRSYIVGETVEWEDGTLKVTGVVRGSSLSANRLVHISNSGDYQILKIMSAPIPRHSKSGHNADGMEVEPTLLAEPDESSADSLVSTNDPDDMANEQTWPTEEEMNGGGEGITDPAIPEAKQGTTPKAVKRVPKGMSEYQASWIVEDDEDGDEEDGDGDENGKEAVMDEDEPEEMEELPVDEGMEVDTRKSVAFEDLDNEEEEKQLNSWRSRQREEEDDLNFPDEIDTPQNIPARERFQRYRGMRSFRASPWDPYENLPRDYARIFQFEDYKRTERAVRRRAEQEEGVVEPGVRATVYVRDVPQDAVNQRPFVLYALQQHEHKVSVLHFTIQRNTEYDGSVRSKDPLILCVGARKLRVNPIYSQHTRGGGKGVNNVHKFERYLRHGITSVATIYGPVVFGKQPCVLLRETEDSQAPQLVAMGTFMDPDTTRIIAKRIILTGHPFKVHKKTATVRYMFFSPEDIHYFKPIQLYTKHGRVGHIRESLGTHGYLKAHFDGPINQMDTVCMSMYKRVYPKWATLWKEDSDIGVAQKHGNASDAMEE